MGYQRPDGTQAAETFSHVAMCTGTFQVPRRLQLPVRKRSGSNLGLQFINVAFMEDLLAQVNQKLISK